MLARGWPSERSDVPDYPIPYYDIRDELVAQGDIVFKGQQLVVPAALRKELKEVTHVSHIGIEACIRRVRDTLYWPQMSKEYIRKCDVCMSYRNVPSKEPLQPHKFVARPWSKVGADLCQLDGRMLFVIPDYYSNLRFLQGMAFPMSL